MKLGMMLEVDETFTWYDFQGHPKSGSRWGDDLSPLLAYFYISFHKHAISQLLRPFHTSNMLKQQSKATSWMQQVEQKDLVLPVASICCF